MMRPPSISPAMVMVRLHCTRTATSSSLRVALNTGSHHSYTFAPRMVLLGSKRLPSAASITMTTSSRTARGALFTSPLLLSSSSATALRSLSFAGMRLQQSIPSSSSTASHHFLPTLLLPNQLGAVAYFSSSGKPPPNVGGRMGWAGGAIGAGALLLGKGKYILGALKVGKLSTMASMILSVGAYSMIFGVPYAVGMVGLIFVHETGHLLVMRHYGIPFSPMVFLPFMGAVIAMKKHPRDAWEDAMIAFGGPVLGSAGAGALAVGASMTDSQLLYALADFGFMINLFNMLPIGDMDGGRIAGALSPWSGVVGLGIGGSMIASGMISNPLVYIIMAVGGYSTFMRFYDPHGLKPPGFYKITDAQRALLGVGYFGLIGTVAGAMALNSIHKKSPEEIQRYQELHFDEREF